MKSKCSETNNFSFNKTSDDGLVTFGYILNDINYEPCTNRKSKNQEYLKTNVAHDLKSF